MVTIRQETHIDAPTERVFDLARSIDLQQEVSTAGGRPVAGVVYGLSTPGESTIWRVPLLGKQFDLTTKITAYSRPTHFRQTTTGGPLTTLVHDHFFAFEDEEPVDGTMLRDVLTFESPLGPVGHVLDRALKRRFTGLLTARNDRIKQVAESDDWRQYIAG